MKKFLKWTGFVVAGLVASVSLVAMSFCSECHGQSLEGFAPINAPPLSVVKGYSDGDFARLMHDGVASGGRSLKLMGPTALARFSNFSAEEVAAIYAFLRARDAG